MDLGLDGRRALVTASTRGIGRACAEALAREGARVAVCGRDPDAVRETVEALGGPAGGHWGLALDLSADGGPERLARAAFAAFGPLDVVVHNLGGTLAARDPLVDPATYAAVWHLNLGVQIALNRVVVPPMRERRWGRLVAISSVAGVEHQGALPYAVAKAALNAYVRGLGRELAADGIVVAAVTPGTVLTHGGVWDERRRSEPEATARYVAERLPAGAFQRPEAIADVVAFLCSERGAEFAGAVVPLDGGQGRAWPSA